MKNMLFQSFIFCAFSILSSSEEANDTSKFELTKHPHWILNKNNLDEDQETLTLIGTLPAASKEQVTFWKDNVKELPYFEKLENIFLNYGLIKEEDMSYLIEFKNIKHLTLGISIEGILMSPEILRYVKNFKKLTSLNIAIHGLNDEHLKIIGELNNLERLSIQFPSVNMIVHNSNQMKLWKKTELSDKSIKELGKLNSLNFLAILHAPQPEDGEVKLTIETLNTLLILPNLKEIHIDATNFTPDARKIINNRKLPDHVQIK